jgi:hypothetical protein
MSFGTPQRVLNLRRDYEKSLRNLGNGDRSAEKSYMEDSLDEDSSSPLRGFSGYGSNTGKSHNGHSGSDIRNKTVRRNYGEDKDQVIMDLREEVERLKAKVNRIVESAETSLTEAIDSQDTLRADYDRKISEKNKEVEYATTENLVLKELVNKLQVELAYEREQVSKSLRFMDRVKNTGNQRIHNVLDKNIFKQHVSQF